MVPLVIEYEDREARCQLAETIETFPGGYATPPAGGPSTVRVLKSEEKGSDVNLATTLLVDAFDGDFEQAVVVSNDSDLAYPVHVVRRELKLRVGVLAPMLDPDTRQLPVGYKPRDPSVTLRKTANYFWLADPGDLAASQFPRRMQDKGGTIMKPARW